MGSLFGEGAALSRTPTEDTLCNTLTMEKLPLVAYY